MKALNLIALSLFATTLFNVNAQSTWSPSQTNYNTAHIPYGLAQQSDGDIFMVTSYYNSGWMYYEKQLYKSTDDGLSWNEINFTGLPNQSMSIAGSLIADGNTLYMLCIGDGTIDSPVKKSVDDGATWTPTSTTFPYGQPQNFYEPIKMTLAANGTMYAVGKNLGQQSFPIIFISPDTGVNWSYVTNTGLDDIGTFNSIVFVDNTLLICGKRESNNSGVIYKSTDGGQTWIESTLGYNTNFQPKDFTVSNSGEIYLAAASYPSPEQVLYKSWDNGSSWVYQPIYGFAQPTIPVIIQSIGTGYLMANTINLMSDIGTIYRSEPNVGTEELQNSNTSVSPNPATNSLTIHSEEAIEAISISDYKGSDISNYTIDGSKVDIAELSSGIYFLSIIKLNDIETIRFIKE